MLSAQHDAQTGGLTCVVLIRSETRGIGLVHWGEASQKHPARETKHVETREVMREFANVEAAGERIASACK